MKPGWAVAWQAGISVLAALLAAAVLFLVGSQPRGEPIRILPAPSPLPLTVHVSGAVAHPGVQTLPSGSRVQDAIVAAGGLLPNADERGVNLAARLEDGQMILVPNRPEANQDASGPGTPSAPSRMDPAAPILVTSLPININTATKEELESLPGIGPVIAQEIIAYRTSNGPFVSTEAILDVPGIGPATFEKIKDLITTGVIP